MFVLGENHFRKCFSGNEAVWLARKILFSGNWNSLTKKKMPLITEIILHFYFPFKAFLENERERERERARAREEKRRMHSRRREIAPDWDRDRRRERKIQDREISYVGERGRSEIVIDASRDRAIDRNLAFARSRRWSRSREEGEIAINGAISSSDASPLARALSLSHFPEMLWRENRSVNWFPWSKAFFFGQRISISGK